MAIGAGSRHEGLVAIPRRTSAHFDSVRWLMCSVATHMSQSPAGAQLDFDPAPPAPECAWPAADVAIPAGSQLDFDHPHHFAFMVSIRGVSQSPAGSRLDFDPSCTPRAPSTTRSRCRNPPQGLSSFRHVRNHHLWVICKTVAIPRRVSARCRRSTRRRASTTSTVACRSPPQGLSSSPARAPGSSG